MKIEGINSAQTKSFKGKRLDRNAVSQLAKNNAYSLTEPNQRYISNAIESLGKIPGEKNIRFLLDVAAQNKYTTNIVLKDLPKNNWKTMLLSAAAAAIAITPLANNSLIEKLTGLKKPQSPNSSEQEILALREQLLGVVDLEQINNETNGTIKDFERNLDYFIISSETNIEHKKYVLEKLNYFMSDEYVINPQLKDKKSIAVAEMVNDMAIHVPGNKVPNIKYVNQKQHGMCAAISIVRKKLAYEDKPNYVDSILSELDATDSIMVYDRSCLGSGKKVAVTKVPVDFDAALSKGYRIIDASTMHWMQIANMSGTNNIAYNIYNPFDKENFDVKADSFFRVHFEDKDMESAQTYYQALIKAKSVIESYKASRIKRDLKNHEQFQNQNKNVEAASRINQSIKNELKTIIPNLSAKEAQELCNNLLQLEEPLSSKIKSYDKFSYIPNEESFVKKQKIKLFITSNHDVETVSNESLDKLLFLLNKHHSLTESNKKQLMHIKANTLYEIAAAFRYQIAAGLNDKYILDNTMKGEGITNKEALLLDTIDTLIKKLEEDSPHSKLIIEQLQQSAFDNTNGSKEETIAALNELKEILSYQLTEALDSIYAALTMGSRKEALLTYLETNQNAIQEGETRVLKAFAELFGLKKSAKNVIKAIEADKQKLLNGDEKDYAKLFDKYGSTSQLEYINNIFQNFVQTCSTDNNSEVVMNFLQVNGIKMEDGAEAVTERIDAIGQNIQAIQTFINQAAGALRVVDKNGDILFSALPQDVIMKKLENENRVTSAKNLRELQTHLDKIAKVRSSDEFQSRQGKLRDKSLSTFSVNEKATLKDVELSVDAMYSLVQKQLKFMRSEMKDTLEELARIAGVHDGRYWATEEGSSGLTSGEDVRVLEYMTGRPHYTSDNYKESIEKIKTSPYSGISSSSVYHNNIGGHAQYIADIGTVTLNNGEQKEVLFNDNTWGASEHENTWIDSKGLTRTDYSDNRGGSLGYITNSEYRNGNLVDRILGDMIMNVEPDTTDNRIYKKIKHPDKEGFSLPQYYNITLDGKSQEIKDISDRIHDAIFVTNTRYLDKLKKIGDNHTESELQAMITDISGTRKNWKNTYEALKNRIFPEAGIGISSQEEYDKLADDDYLKVVLEKIALKQNYPISGLEPELAKVRSLKELSKFRSAQKTRALNSFKYSFSKTKTVIDFLADSYGDEEFIKMQAILDKHNIKLTDDELNSIGEVFGIDNTRFNGSLKNTINLIMENISEDIKAVVKDENAAKELEDFFRNFMEEKIYFNKSDLDLSDLDNQKIEHVIKFIDRVFDPADDDEFVEIYRKIQDMTEEEFKNEILSKATYEDMGVKTISGYDVLKSIKRYEENANTSLINTVYYDSLVAETNKEKYETYYTYDKLSRKTRIKANYEFSTMYRDLQNDLSALTYQKMFNKYKGRNLENYGAYPSYPRVEYLTEEHIRNSFDSTIEKIEKNIDVIKTLKEQLQNYEIAALFEKLLDVAPQGMIISGNNYTYLNNLFGRLLTLNYNDPSVKEISDAASDALEFEEGTPWTLYEPLVKQIIKKINEFKNTSSKDVLIQVMQQDRSEILANKMMFKEAFIQPKYKSRFAEKLNKLEQTLIRQDKEKAEILKAELLDDFRKYHILNDPEELLKQFILSNGKDSRLSAFKNIFEQLMKRAIDFAQLIEIQDILMDAVKEGVALNTKTRFSKHSLTFGDAEYSMDSDMSISYMANKLILDNQFETALMFLEKLGLNEQYVKYTAESMDYDALEKLIRDTHKLAFNFNKFQNAIEPAIVATLETFKDPKCDYELILTELRTIIYEKATEFSLDEETLSPLLNGIEAIEYNCDTNPDVQKDLLFSTIMNTSKEKLVEKMSEVISENDTVLGANTTILNFMNQIMVPEGSEAYKAILMANERFNKLAEIRDELISLQGDENSDKI